MEEYKQLVEKVFFEGEGSDDRTGTGTRRIFGHSMTFDCSKSFPLVTLKYTHFKSIVHELLWFISGETKTAYLDANGITIWDEWADPKGNLGPIYGYQWRNAGGTYRTVSPFGTVQNGHDQLGKAIELIRTNPTSRRIIVDAWQARDLPDEALSPQENVGIGKMALAPCHMFYQFFVHSDGTLDIQMYQRSVDVFLGLPFNIASYALLLKMVAQVTKKKPGRLIWVGGDIHLYNNHKNQAIKLLSREPKELPRVKLNKEIENIDDFTFEDIELVGYDYHPSIKAEISV